MRKWLATTAAIATVLAAETAWAGGSGLEIEAALTPWWTFGTSTLPWWIGTIAAVIAGAIICFGGFMQGGAKIISVIFGIAILAGAVTWFVQSLGLAQGALL